MSAKVVRPIMPSFARSSVGNGGNTYIPTPLSETEDRLEASYCGAKQIDVPTPGRIHDSSVSFRPNTNSQSCWHLSASGSHYAQAANADRASRYARYRFDFQRPEKLEPAQEVLTAPKADMCMGDVSNPS